ncbi:hypothetical protein BX600DRAFT_447295 [Xylariales sp. PMI_506]|nr:hypothetical protein BX600DRAFT_447295 [Xylariales sp. PMI_506]
MIHHSGSPVMLDTPLTAEQATALGWIIDEAMASGFSLRQPLILCAVCHLPKFKGVTGSSHTTFVSRVLTQLPTVSDLAFEDFDPIWGTSKCCRRYVCKTCLSAAVISGIAVHWWFDLSNEDTTWLKCPVPCCDRSLPLRTDRDVVEILQTLGVQDSLAYGQRFKRASILRSALQQLDPLPSRDQLRRSKALHDRLVRFGWMRPLLTEDARVDMQSSPTAMLVPIDTADGQRTMQVPVFTSLLRPQLARICIVCDERYIQFDYKYHQQSWVRATKGFGTDWTWRILSFPADQVLPNCHHDNNICRDCLAKYIATQLETQGHGAVDNISCPELDCGRKYTHGEIQSLASPESFALYDRYIVLRSISSLPNFRWCLREGCVSGGLYDSPEVSPSPIECPSTVDNNCIVCSECGFTMCYSCQSPWHPSLTCAQQASLSQQGGAAHSMTQAWLARHTKPCPGDGCGVQVQKGDGCFHMTCSRCRFEFCWECLADWKGILEPGDGNIGNLRAEGHYEGCFFRRPGAPLPTTVTGCDLETGLRRLEQIGREHHH